MPYRFNPVNPGTPLEMAIAAFNNNFAQLDQEAAVKTFNGPTGDPLIVQGELSNGFYGTEYRDTDGNVTKVEGFDPNGNFIELTVKDGEDAYTVLGY